MTFLTPEYFWLVIVLLLMMLYRKKKKEHTMAKHTRQKLLLLYLSLIMMILALARPALDKGAIKQEFEGSEVVIALDLSYSMQAEDIEPNRFEASKAFIKELTQKRVHERFALLGFTTNAIILSPLTSDDELLSHQLDLISPELVITKGTNMASVLELSTKLSTVKSKNLIIIGDGGDTNDFSKEIAYAKEHGISIAMVMMATSSGARLKGKDGKWMKDSSDHLVISSKNMSAEALSKATDGVFIDNSDNAVDALSSWLDTREKKLSSADLIMYKELFYYPAFFALVFFLLGVTKLHVHIFKSILFIAVLMGINAEANMKEFSTPSSGDTAYAQEKDLKALTRFKELSLRSPEDHYNLGNAYYRAGQYEEAIDTYKEVRSTDRSLKAKVFHNLGNSYIRLEMYDEARIAFKKSLILEYNKETDENLLYISGFKKHEGLQTGQQKGKKKNDSVAVKGSKKEGQKKKGAGSSNMKVAAQAGASVKSKGKKVKNEGQVSFNAKQSGLSYRQYELINERSVNEENPW
ncbi:tetratricopeptide repeat protein [Campylobacterota bacterium]